MYPHQIRRLKFFGCTWVLLLSLGVCGGCAHESIMVVEKQAQTEAVAAHKNMAKIAEAGIKAYHKIQVRYYEENFYRDLEDLAAKRDGKLSVGFVKVMHKLLVKKLRVVDGIVNGAYRDLAEAQVDFDRYLELSNAVIDGLKRSDLNAQDFLKLKGDLQGVADDFLRAKQQEQALKLQDRIRDLEHQMDSAEGEDAAAVIRGLKTEMEKARERKRILDGMNFGPKPEPVAPEGPEAPEGGDDE